MKYIKYLILVIAVLAGVGYYMWNKPKQSIERKDADYVMAPENLLQEFQSNEENANKKYLDKIVSVKGKINSMSADTSGVTSIQIDTGDPMSSITCQLSKDQSEKNTDLKEGNDIQIKGICTGMLMDVILVDCVVVEN